jgi:hypothetical protein
MAEEGGEEPAEIVAPTTGTGKFIFPDGSVYEGDWSTSDGGVMKRHGEGTYKAGENEYVGAWVEDAMEGAGKFTFASGAVYEGAWKGNQFMGEGQYTWGDNSSYTGGWADNKMHGKGTYVDGKKEIYEGEFFNGNGPDLLNIQ